MPSGGRAMVPAPAGQQLRPKAGGAPGDGRSPMERAGLRLARLAGSAEREQGQRRRSGSVREPATLPPRRAGTHGTRVLRCRSAMLLPEACREL